MESSQVKIVLSAFVHDHLTKDLSYYIFVSVTKKFVCFYCLLFSLMYFAETPSEVFSKHCIPTQRCPVKGWNLCSVISFDVHGLARGIPIFQNRGDWFSYTLMIKTNNFIRFVSFAVKIRTDMTSSGVDWSTVEGASKKPKRLHLVGNEEGIFQCPVLHCDHMGFSSQRGCRKHVRNKHGWLYYFDVKPDLKLSRTNVRPQGKGSILLEKSHLAQTSKIPSFTKDTPFRHEIVNWLQSMAGGGESKCLANQVLSKSMKYIQFCSEDFLDEEVTESNIDYCLGSTTHIYRSFYYLEKDFDVSASGRTGYINALLDLMDFRKFKELNFDTLQNFSFVEIYLKRIRKCMGKEMRIHWENDLDVDTLESKGSWATLKELQSVLPNHLPQYKVIVENCKTCTSLVSPSDLTFATGFIATFLFLGIKATRPMTYQTTGGYIDQKLFKTTGTYGFDSIILDNISMKVIGNYIEFVRSLLQPSKSCFILVNRNGTQFGKLTDLLNKLVYDAIGKYIHPTRYRQIVETESSAILDLDEQQWVSEDQKHSSKVAKTHYQKKRSRDIAVK